MSVLMRRILPHILRHRRPEQSGFTPGRSTIDCILALQVLAEQRREFRQPLLAAYVDLKSAFDSIYHYLWKLLQGIGVPPKLLKLIRAFHEGSVSQVRTDGILSAPFPCSSGVRQGCVAAPNLFNVAIDFWLKRIIDRTPELGVSYHSTFKDLCYADDVVIFAELTDVIVRALRTMHTGVTVRVSN